MSVEIEKVRADVADPTVLFRYAGGGAGRLRESELREMLARVVEAKEPNREYDAPATHAFTVFAESAQRIVMTVDWIDEKGERRMLNIETWVDRKLGLEGLLPGGVLYVAVAGSKCWDSRLGRVFGEVECVKRRCPKCGTALEVWADPSVWKKGGDRA